MKKILGKENHPFWVLTLASLFATGMLALRLYVVDIDDAIYFDATDANYIVTAPGTMLFFIWNLFLAWLPYFVALSLPFVYQRIPSKWVLGFLLLVWLLFFPNAPYIITDFVHLRPIKGLPRWYDITMFSTFAGTGLMLGLLSMREVERFLARHSTPWKARAAMLATLPLCGFGIWMGRYQRWNSWDVFSRPDAVLLDVWRQIKDPVANMDTLGLAVAITMMMFLSYFMMKSLTLESR